MKSIKLFDIILPIILGFALIVIGTIAGESNLNSQITLSSIGICLFIFGISIGVVYRIENISEKKINNQ